MDVKFDFSDVDAAIESFKKNDVVGRCAEIGQEAVEYARDNGDYHDRSGKLRKHNKYAADESGLEIYNDAGYARKIESKGYDVISGAALFAEKRLKEDFE